MNHRYRDPMVVDFTSYEPRDRDPMVVDFTSYEPYRDRDPMVVDFTSYEPYRYRDPMVVDFTSYALVSSNSLVIFQQHFYYLMGEYPGKNTEMAHIPGSFHLAKPTGKIQLNIE
jgi:hypothetical protein